MKEATRKEIKRLINLNNITKTNDEVIEEIADRFTDEYHNEQQYVDFQIEIYYEVALALNL